MTNDPLMIFKGGGPLLTRYYQLFLYGARGLGIAVVVSGLTVLPTTKFKDILLVKHDAAYSPSLEPFGGTKCRVWCLDIP